MRIGARHASNPKGAAIRTTLEHEEVPLRTRDWTTRSDAGRLSVPARATNGRRRRLSADARLGGEQQCDADRSAACKACLPDRAQGRRRTGATHCALLAGLPRCAGAGPRSSSYARSSERAWRAITDAGGCAAVGWSPPDLGSRRGTQPRRRRQAEVSSARAASCWPASRLSSSATSCVHSRRAATTVSMSTFSGTSLGR
jgi:hypothetical protein